MMGTHTERGRLSIVATPIGNLGDITFRALWNLKECKAIYAEDTRVTLKLLNHYGVRNSVFRLDAATEQKKIPEILERLARGEHVVYVVDAGTPAVSDPGTRLVARVRAESISIDTIPGPSALTAALAVAGVPMEKFLFLGFLPHKKGRQTMLKDITKSAIPVILYESPYRILKLLKEIHAVAPRCRVMLFRELTKVHEEVLEGTSMELAERLERHKKVRGEFVVIVNSSTGGQS